MNYETSSTYTGHANCSRCGDEIAPHRKLCDVCRKVPNYPDDYDSFNPELPDNLQPCMHENCPGCKNGTCSGIHLISCPCPKCTSRC